MTGTRPPSDACSTGTRAPEHNVEAVTGLDERLRDAVERKQEFRGPEVDHELVAQAEE